MEIPPGSPRGGVGGRLVVVGGDVEASMHPTDPGSVDAVLCWKEAGPGGGNATQGVGAAMSGAAVGSPAQARHSPKPLPSQDSCITRLPPDGTSQSEGSRAISPHEHLRSRFMVAKKASLRGRLSRLESDRQFSREEGAASQHGQGGMSAGGHGAGKEEPGGRLLSVSMEEFPHGLPQTPVVASSTVLGGSDGRVEYSKSGLQATPLEKSRMQTEAQDKLRRGLTEDALAMHDALHTDRIKRFQCTMDGGRGGQTTARSKSGRETGSNAPESPGVSPLKSDEKGHDTAISRDKPPSSPSDLPGRGLVASSRSSWRSNQEDSGGGTPMWAKRVGATTQLDFKANRGESVIERLKTVKALALSSAFHLPRVRISMSLAEVAAVLLNNRGVIVDGWICGKTNKQARDVLWDKAAFMERAVQVTDMSAPVETIVEDIPICPTVREDDTLDQVWKTMVAFKIEHVGTKNSEGNVTGLLLFDDLYEFVASHLLATDGQVPREDSLMIESPMSFAGGMGMNVSTHKANTSGIKGNMGKGAECVDKMRVMNQMALDTAGDGQQADDLELFDFKRMVALKRGIGRSQLKADRWLRNLYTEASIVVLLIIDCSLVIVNAATGNQPSAQGPFMAARGMILFLSTLEAWLRIYAYRLDLLNGIHMLECFDIIVVLLSCIIYIVEIIPRIASGSTDRGSYASIIIRGFRFVRIVRVLKIMGRFRKFISRNKARYTINGFDLDLCYVTPELIAMSLPAIGAEAHFRNPISEVMRFFHTMHPKKYMIFNLCAERDYDTSLFDGRVVRLNVEDHNPPRLDQIISFVEQCAQFLSEDAMEFFALKRTGNRAKAVQGVSGVSQRRYLHYIEKVFANGGYNHSKRMLKSIRMVTTPSTGQGRSCRPWFTVEENGIQVYSSPEHGAIETMTKNDAFKVFSLPALAGSMDKGLALMGDVRICFYHNEFLQGDDLFCYLWFHTDFVQGMSLDFSKAHIDGAWSDTQCRIFSENFHIIMTFDAPATSLSMASRRHVHKPDFRIIERARNMRESEGFEYRAPIKRSTSGESTEIAKAKSMTFDQIVIQDDEEACDPGGVSEVWDPAMAQSKWQKAKDFQRTAKQIARGVSLVASQSTTAAAARAMAAKGASAGRRASLVFTNPRKSSATSVDLSTGTPHSEDSGNHGRSSKKSGGSYHEQSGEGSQSAPGSRRRRSTMDNVISGFLENSRKSQTRSRRSSVANSFSSSSVLGESFKAASKALLPVSRSSELPPVSAGISNMPPLSSQSHVMAPERTMSPIMSEIDADSHSIFSRVASDITAGAQQQMQIPDSSLILREEEEEEAPSPPNMRAGVPGGPVDGRDEPSRGRGVGRVDREEMC